MTKELKDYNASELATEITKRIENNPTEIIALVDLFLLLRKFATTNLDLNQALMDEIKKREKLTNYD